MSDVKASRLLERLVMLTTEEVDLEKRSTTFCSSPLSLGLACTSCAGASTSAADTRAALVAVISCSAKCGALSRRARAPSHAEQRWSRMRARKLACGPVPPDRQRDLIAT